jgi:Fe(3+) dicitrate transport protein
MTSAELIAFFSDYANLKGTCSLSTGCPSDQIGDEFNGGRVHVYGVEAMAHAELPLEGSLRVPLRASYTFNGSRFRTAFESKNPEWGDIAIGDELPYFPAHHVSVQVGVGRAAAAAPEHAGPRPMRWELTLAGRYTSAMRNIAGQGEPAPEQRTDAITVLDLSASHDLGRWGRAYVTVDNLLDQAHMVSRHPYGARPGKPRIILVGYKNRF